ncbi:lysostaphin resistance A-like protein [Chamaesiphon sp.]|uniref:CPBP family intramembrane glutamic endopeptidase n=1 Tax=Chamaesiphon sp. TaxID=2814140 RepID=UPI00359414E8
MQDLSTIRFDRLKVRHLLLAFGIINVAIAILLISSGIDVNNKLFTPLSYLSSFLATCVWICYRCQQVGIDLLQVIGKPDRQVRWWQIIGLAVAGVIFSLASFIVFLGLISYLFPQFTEQVLVSITSRNSLTPSADDTPLDRLLVFLMLVVVAPLAEELIFRGVILHRWAQKWSLPTSVIVTSLVFGFLHINPIGISMFGLVLALLYLKTKTLWVPIAAHAINNFIVFCMTLQTPSATETTSLSLQSLQSNLWAGLVMMGISLFFLGRFIRRNFPVKQLASSK